MYKTDPLLREKRKGPRLLFLIPILIILGLTGYFYGPRLYYQLSEDPLTRLERRSQHYESRLLSGAALLPEQYDYIQNTETIINVLQKDRPLVAEIHYYRGLFRFYDLLLRLPLNARSLLALTGREILPVHLPLEKPEPVSIIPLAARCSRIMRKALALDPDFKVRSMALLAIVYGDLFSTARTDPGLLNRIVEIDVEQIRPALLPYYDWIALAIFSLKGEYQKLQILLEKMEKSGAPKSPDQPLHRLKLTANEALLLRCIGAWRARDYILALQLARRISADPKAPPAIKIEALRLEGEIFIKQRGLEAGRKYFQQALELSEGKDDFIKSRMETLFGPP